MGRRASLGKARLRWRGGACPREGKGGGRDEGTPRRGGRQSSPQPGAARNPPPPFTQRGPGTPLPARAAQPAQACGLRSSYCCPGGFLGPGSRGGRPAPPSAPARPPGRLCQAKAMATRWLLCLSAAPALLLAAGKGAGAVRRRPQGLQANPPLLDRKSVV